MAWLYLLLAGACEMAWPLGFKYTNGFKAHYWLIALTLAILIVGHDDELALGKGLQHFLNRIDHASKVSRFDARDH